MKKIIHLSDLHIGHDDCTDNFRLIIEKITESKQPAEDYIIVITGDIVDNANHYAFTDEAVSLIGQVERSGYRVLVVPGNHDYGTGVIGNPKFQGIFRKKYFRTRRIRFPKLDIIDDIAFIGLDSMADELHWLDRFFSEGELGQTQLRRLKRILNRPEITDLKKVVYLHHHPFDYKAGMQLKDSHDLKKIIENRIDMLLFGHYHADAGAAGKNNNGTWGIIRCYNGGSSTHKNGNKGFQRIIDLSSDDPSADYDGCFI